MFNLLFCTVNYIFVSASVSPHLKMGALDARDFINMGVGAEKNRKIGCIVLHRLCGVFFIVKKSAKKYSHSKISAY